MCTKTVTVFGFEADLGVKSILKALNGPYKVRFVNSYEPATDVPPGVTAVDVNPDNLDDFVTALEGSYACVLYPRTVFDKPALEVQHGKNVATACAKVNISHIILNTQISVKEVLGLSALHFDNKSEIESEIKRLQLPLTSMIIPIYYERLINAPLVPKKDGDAYYLDIPMGDVPLDLVGGGDMGGIVLSLMEKEKSVVNKTMALSTNKQTVKEIAATMASHQKDIKIFYKQITLEDFKARHPIPGIDHFVNMFQFFKRVDQKNSVHNTMSINPSCQSLDEWACQNAEQIRKAILES